MPGNDRTGPEGMGPNTGRGLGFCTGFLTADNAAAGGRGFGRGRGRRGGGGGHGWRNRFRMTGMPGWMRWGQSVAADAGLRGGDEYKEETAAALKAEARALEKQLRSVQSRIEALEPRQDSSGDA